MSQSVKQLANMRRAASRRTVRDELQDSQHCLCFGTSSRRIARGLLASTCGTTRFRSIIPACAQFKTAAFGESIDAREQSTVLSRGPDESDALARCVLAIRIQARFNTPLFVELAQSKSRAASNSCLCVRADRCKRPGM